MCGEQKNGTDEDRNRRTGSHIDTQGIQLRKLLKYATVDPANPRIYTDCPKKGCGEKIVTYVESKDTKKRTFKCPSCLAEFT